ncbi:hypothetical protein SKAU_G00398720 [Synaphobranchus kaupii]|uniref:Uncharacterized protein n=1 Tax=Synaphobranchus kaupii TaxID=118154 RepID=A0A9Q1E8K2_SYNKA|nr:hypothetical protein SKAU_G00398720 [Synaphobranchus kaupii]
MAKLNQDSVEGDHVIREEAIEEATEEAEDLATALDQDDRNIIKEEVLCYIAGWLPSNTTRLLTTHMEAVIGSSLPML